MFVYNFVNSWSIKQASPLWFRIIKCRLSIFKSITTSVHTIFGRSIFSNLAIHWPPVCCHSMKIIYKVAWLKEIYCWLFVMTMMLLNFDVVVVVVANVWHIRVRSSIYDQIERNTYMAQTEYDFRKFWMLFHSKMVY